MLGKEVLVVNHYSYDRNGNRTERQQPGGTTRYTYDSENQLTKIEYPAYTEQLYYDKAGNRSRRITDGTQEEYRYDPANHLTEYTRGGETTTFTYDKAGNLTADDRARYTYDLFNRTEKVETFDGHVQINHYDAEGLRSGIEEDGRLVQFIFRSQEVVTQLEEEKGMTRYIRGYDLIASDADSARTYYHYASDELGSITHVVAGEDILNRYEYDAWGNLTLCEETVENRFKFNGQQYDPISQQYYLRARYYNPVIGRFTQEDTYRGDGLNLYAYCRNNPVYYADPSGHYRNCVKDAYDRIRQENPGMSAQDAYNLALKETGKDRIPNDTAQNTEQNRRQNPEPEGPDTNRALLNGEEWYQYFKDQYGAENVEGSVYNWSQQDLQNAIDDIYLAGVKRTINPETGDVYNGGPRQTVTVTPDGKVLISQNSSAVDPASRDRAQQIFGDNVIFIPGGQNVKMPGLPDNYGNHAEVKGIYYLNNNDISTEGAKQFSSHYSCDSCQSQQRSNGVLNYTGYASDHNNVQKRIDYKSILLNGDT